MDTLEKVKAYYGKILKSNRDLATTACCSLEQLPSYLRTIADKIHPEVKERFYGCGSNIPLELKGRTVLDLGSGSGRDCYLLSALVGQEGLVVGVDMTDEQIAVAEKHLTYHTKEFGFTNPNVRFVKGYIEDLEDAGIKSSQVDVVISNCVTNLSPDKPRVFSEAFRVLKPGGELFFSDVFCDRRLPDFCKEDPQLLGECLGGAMYFEDFRRLMTSLGCADFRIVGKNPIRITNEEVQAKVGRASFTSYTIRAFKLDLEDRCEDYGQVAYYQGTIPEAPHAFMLDDHHLFEKDRPLTVCSNTAAMLTDTRYAPHFRVEGNLETHFGLFPCGPVVGTNATASGACC